MSKRTSLREFQQNLTARLSSVKHGDAVRTLLGVESGGALWLIDLADSGEVIPLSELTPVPLTRHWYAGLVNVRGMLYSVIDFSVFRGSHATPRNSEARLVMIGARHGINSALLVGRALGLRPLNSLTRQADDESAPPWGRLVYDDTEGRRWHRLNVRELLADPIFLDVAA